MALGFNKRQAPSSELEKQPILQHISELRRVVRVSVIAIVAAIILVFALVSDPLMAFIEQPLRVRGISIIGLTVQEIFMAKMMISLLGGLIAAFPVVLWQFWSYLKPALFPHERKAVRMMFLAAMLLFIIGVVFAYTLVLGMAINFFIGQIPPESDPNRQYELVQSIRSYINFLVGFVFPFGIAFELPMVLLVLTRLGMVTPAKLKKVRKYVILAIAVVAAIITPPDVVSMTLLSLPMVGLYEIGILISKTVKKKKDAKAAAL